MLRRLAIALASATVATAPLAAQTTYTSSADWLTAVGAGNVSWTVDFSAFGSDTPFRTSPVDAGPFSLQQVGVQTFRNLIDVPPLEFTDNNGTTHASMFTDFGHVTVDLRLDAPISAWGADFGNVSGGEQLVLDLFGPTNTLLASLGVTQGFFGFVLAGGQTVDRISFRSATDNGILGSGEGFGMDNVRGVAASTVPEPSTYALLGTGLLAVGGIAARRRRATA